APFSLAIRGLADDSSGELADIRLLASQNAKVGPTVRQVVAQALALGDDNIRTIRIRPAEHTQTDRIDADDGKRARFMRGSNQRLDILKLAKEIRVLENDGGGFRSKHSAELLRITMSVLRGHGDDFGLEIRKRRAHNLHELGMHGFR